MCLPEHHLDSNSRLIDIDPWVAATIIVVVDDGVITIHKWGGSFCARVSLHYRIFLAWLLVSETNTQRFGRKPLENREVAAASPRLCFVFMLIHFVVIFFTIVTCTLGELVCWFQ